MAQSSSRTGGQVSPGLLAKNLAVSVAGTGDTLLLTVNTLGLTRLAGVILPTVQNLDNFIIAARFHPDTPAVSVYASGFTSPTGILVATSSDLDALAAAATGWFLLDVAGIYEIQLKASAASDSDLVDIYAMGS